MNEIEKRVTKSMEVPYSDMLAGAAVSVHLNLKDFNFSEEIQDCINNKKVFGLSNLKNSFIVFEPDGYNIYDLTNNNLVTTRCRSYMDFLNYIKLSIIGHRHFLPSQACVDYFKAKNLLT